MPSAPSRATVEPRTLMWSGARFRRSRSRYVTRATVARLRAKACGAGVTLATRSRREWYYIVLHRGCDVDQPRNLAKSVTVE